MDKGLKKTGTRRILSLLLAIIMTIAMLPAGVFAAGSGYSVTVSTDSTAVEAGSTVTLNITVTNNGEEITDLSAAGLSMTTWLDYYSDNGHADGNDDAVISDEHSLVTVVTLPSEGTYYIVTELYDISDNSWNILASCTTVFTVTSSTSSGTTDDSGADLTITPVDTLACDFAMGVDISSVMSEFASGVTYKDFEGNTINNITDFCKFLKTCGVTHVRVRVWNNPYDSNGNGYGGGNNDVDTAVKIAEGCAAAGLKMLVDFHCSDFWTDPGKQQAPKAWSGYTLSQKSAALQEFLADALDRIGSTRAEIDMVQVGNETTSGFIGETSYSNMCTLFSAGSAAVRAYDSDIKIVIHVTNPESSNMTTWARILNNYAVDYDVLATSYYPYWHGSLSNLTSQMAAVQNTYNKEVMVAETSYAYTLDDTDGHDNTVREGSNDSSSSYPFTVDGQEKFLCDLITTVSDAGGIGVFYWEPAWITVGDTTGLSGDALSAQISANKQLWEQYGSGWASSYAAEYDPSDAGVWYGGSAVDNQALFSADGSPLESVTIWNQVKPAGYGHSWDAGVETTAPTTTQEGVKTYTCTVCGETRTESVPMLEEETEPPTVSLSLSQNNGKIRMTGVMTNVDQTTSHGFIYITKARLGAKTLTVNTSGRTKLTVNGYNDDGSYAYSMTPKTDSTRYAIRAFVTYENEAGKTVYVYSDPIYVSYNQLI